VTGAAPGAGGTAIPLVVLAGAAGTGKTTAGRRLARRLGAALLDLDTVGGPLARALLAERTGDPYDDASTFAREVVRPLRYRTLTDIALEVLGCGTGVVVAAPWTRELADPSWHGALSGEAARRGAALAVVWLHCDPATRRARLAARGEPRDAGALAADLAPLPPPRVPHAAVDTTALSGAALDAALDAAVALP